MTTTIQTLCQHWLTLDQLYELLEKGLVRTDEPGSVSVDIFLNCDGPTRKTLAAQLKNNRENKP